MPATVTEVRTPQTTSSRKGELTLRAYAGDGDVLLAYSLDRSLLEKNRLAGFAIQCTPPAGHPYFLLNRLSFGQAVSNATTPQQRTWTSSYDAPFQKFHWVHFPADIVAGDHGHHVYRYKVIARYCEGDGLVDGPSAEIEVDLSSQAFEHFEFGFTRGYLTSQAYADKFHNAPFRKDKTLDYDTAPYQAQYEWLGYHARKMVFNLLQESVADESITCDVFAYDLDEPDVVRMLEALGPRLRIFLDNAKLHTGTALEVKAHTRLVHSAGTSNVRQGHFKRFAHDKIIIQKKNDVPVKVLTGSANFSVRGLYVQANNVMVFDNPAVAGLYEKVFDEAFDDMSGFSHSDLAKSWFPFGADGGEAQEGVPNFAVSFAPHADAAVSMADVEDAVKNAKSSILFAVMQLGGKGKVLQTLDKMHDSGKIFSYGMTQSDSGFHVYRPGEPGVLVPFSALDKQVPPPFNKEWRGGQGQVIHDKFIVIDFNDKNPIVFTGSSNLAEGGEQSNGDNLLAFHDPIVAQAFAVEAIRMVDHYHFRAAVQKATHAEPLKLTACDGDTPWWTRDYNTDDMRNTQRQLYALGPAAATPPVVSRRNPTTGATIKAQAGKKHTAKKKAQSKKH